jgi:molybdopterin converting factor subunit 1
MKVRVRFFAALREHVERAEVVWELDPQQTVGDLWNALRNAFPALGDLSGHVAFAVNREYVDSVHCLHDNDEVAIIPPVSGGIPHVPSDA